MHTTPTGTTLIGWNIIIVSACSSLEFPAATNYAVAVAIARSASAQICPSFICLPSEPSYALQRIAKSSEIT